MTEIDVNICCNQEPDDEFEHAQVDSGQGFTVDAEILPLLRFLWKHGIKTLCSCQGDTHVKHGIFGEVHDHPAFVTVETLNEATATYALLAQYCQDLVLERAEPSHGLSDEYVISTFNKSVLVNL